MSGLAIWAVACGGAQGRGGGGDGDGDGSDSQASERGRDPGGHITFVYKKEIWRVRAAVKAEPVNISKELDKLSPGEDESPAVSKDGAWLTIITSRWECNEQPCLAVIKGDLSGGGLAMTAEGKPVQPSGRAAISNDGNIAVFPWNEGPHPLDLFVIRREGPDKPWSTPKLLTGKSTEQYNDQPAMSGDGKKVLFDCGPEPYAANGTSICEMATDGTQFRKRVDANKNPLGEKGDYALHHPDYAPDGTIVFEADWGGEQIWGLAAGASEPKLIGDDFGNDNSPCVLPSGYIASLWLGDPLGKGLHELKAMDKNGRDPLLITPIDLDVSDVGMSCHGPE